MSNASTARCVRTSFLALLVLVASVFSASAQNAGADARIIKVLWVADDVTKMMYQVSETGLLVSSFTIPRGAASEVAVDPSDGTLWAVDEAGGASLGRLVHLSRTGTNLGEIDATAFGANSPEGVVVDVVDDTLWVVDDPASPGRPNVYNLRKDGTLLSSFPTSRYDPEARSPQGIAIDAFDGTLWITDNRTDRIYNVSRSGTLLYSFPSSLFDPASDNPQGITTDEGGLLRITDRTTGRIHTVSPAGVPVRSIASSVFDGASTSPTGVALDRLRP